MSMRSLRTRIVILVFASIVSVLLPLVVLTYAFMMSEVDELFDARLAENAKTIDALDASSGDTSDAKIIASTQARSKAAAATRWPKRASTSVRARAE